MKMLFRFGIFVSIVLLPVVAFAQERVPAKPGQSCKTYNTGCENFCKTKSSDPTSCMGSCKQQIDNCRAGGVWPLEKGTKLVTGLPLE